MYRRMKLKYFVMESKLCGHCSFFTIFQFQVFNLALNSKNESSFLASSKKGIPEIILSTICLRENVNWFCPISLKCKLPLNRTTYI